MLVKGSYYTGTDDGAVNLIKADDGRYLSFGRMLIPFLNIALKGV
jgi:hypothetical protein